MSIYTIIGLVCTFIIFGIVSILKNFESEPEDDYVDIDVKPSKRRRVRNR